MFSPLTGRFSVILEFLSLLVLDNTFDDNISNRAFLQLEIF